MKRVYANRASTIIFNFLRSIKRKGVFLLPANICPIVPLTFQKSRCKFEFVDITMDDYLIDKKEVLSRLIKKKRNYSGVLFNRTYGMLSSVNKFFREIKNIDKKLIIIDDRCLSVPNLSHDGMQADLTLFSTGKTKYTNGPPGGFGFVSKNISYHAAYAEQWDPLDLSDLTAKYKQAIATKKKFSYIDSAWLDCSKPKWSMEDYRDKIQDNLKKTNRIKKETNQIYYNNLPKSIQLPKEYQNWRFNIMVSNKDKILSKIFENGLFASSHYASIGNVFGTGEFKNTANLHAQIINLFNDNHFSPILAEKTCEIINNYYH